MTQDRLTIAVEKTIGVFSVILIVLGSIGNLCSFGVCLRKKLNSTPAFFYAAISLASQTIHLYQQSLENYNQAFAKKDLMEPCSIQLFFQIFTTHVLTWHLVLMSVERLAATKNEGIIKTVVSNWAPYTSTIVSSILFCVCIVTNVFFQDKDAAVVSMCPEERYTLNKKIAAYTGIFIPCMIIGVINTFIIRDLYHEQGIARRRAKHYPRRQQTSYFTLAETVSFMGLTLPYSIAIVYFHKETNESSLIITFLSFISSIYHSTGFLRLIVSSEQFTQELKLVARLNRNTKIHTTDTENIEIYVLNSASTEKATKF